MFPFTSTPAVIQSVNEQKICDVIRFNGLFVYYVRLSSANKKKLMNNLVPTIRNVDTLSSLMNMIINQTLLYHKVVRSQVDAINYDKILQDHNRMITDKELDTYSVQSDIDWFQHLSEYAQESIIISLSRCSGAEIIAHLYKIVSQEYSRRKKQRGIIKDSIDEYRNFMRKEENVPSIHLECERHQNEYSSLIAEYRKKIFGTPKKLKMTPKKSKKPKLNTKSKKSNKSKKSKKESKIQTNEEFDIEMMQLMPIWIVKKILSYLDAKTLSSVKKIDSYWKWVVDDYFKDVKMRKKLNEIHANLLSTLNKDYDGQSNFLIRIVEEPMQKTFYERKMKALSQRGAMIEKLRHANLPLAKHSILYDAILENKDYELNARLNSPRFRVAKEHIPIYTKPKILYKDLGIFGLQNEIFTDSSINITLDSELPEEESLNSCKRNRSCNDSLGIIQ